MYWRLTPYAGALILSALLSGAIAVHAWRRRSAAGAVPAVLFMLAAAEWSMAYALELSSFSLASKVFWAKVQYLGIVTTAPAMLTMVLQYTGRDRWLAPRYLALLAIVPLLTLLLVWTNDLHGLIWQDARLVTTDDLLVLVLDHGTGFWLIITYSYLCVSAGTWLLLQSFVHSPRFYRAQTGVMLAGTLAPWLGNAIYAFHLSPFPYLDLTPFGFTVSGLAATWGMFRFQLLDIVPIARYRVLESMADGVLVLDTDGRIVDMNPVAQQLIGYTASESIGQPAERVLSRWPKLVERYRGVSDTQAQITVEGEEGQRHFNLHISPVRDRRAKLTGRVIVLHETTTLREQAQALRKQQEQLEAQNIQVRKLSLAVEQSANVVMITDLQGRIEYVNPKFEQVTGYATAEVVGQNPRILKSGQQGDDFYRELWQTITSGQEWHGEFHNRRKDGTLYWEQAAITPIYDATGQMTHFVAVKEDITQRKEAEQALSRLLELSRVLAATRDMDAALSYAAKAAVEIVQSADRGTLQWLDDSHEVLSTVAFSDPEQIPKIIPVFNLGIGVAGHALATRQIIYVPDVSKDERFIPGDPAIVYRSLLVAPLAFQDKALGTLSLTCKRDHAFSPTDEALIGLVADQIAAALENARAFAAREQAEEALKRYTERLQIQHELDQAILAARLPENVAVAAIRRIRQLIPCQRVVVMAVDQNGQTKLLAAESSGKLGLVTDLGVYREVFSEQTLKQGWAQGVEDLSARPQRSPLQELLYKEGVRSFVITPLFIHEELVGTLNLESSTPRAFSADHITIATEIAASLAVAISQARLYEQAQQEIAERIEAERALRRHAAELAIRNAELDAFAHTVAHDLKNPVNAIVGYAEVLKEKFAMLPPETLQRFLNTLSNSARKMDSIIDELLLLASVRQMEAVEVHPLEMGQIVAEARGSLLHQIEELKGEIVLPENWPVALGYAPWVEAVWTNYISNALKYGARPPRVELGATVEEEGWVRFWVRDNGPGLSAEEQAHLFTPFERLRQERIQGHGLGLSIVQRIVKRLGGQVGVESERQPGQGCTFYFTLPGVPSVSDELTVSE